MIFIDRIEHFIPCYVLCMVYGALSVSVAPDVINFKTLYHKQYTILGSMPTHMTQTSNSRRKNLHKTWKIEAKLNEK